MKNKDGQVVIFPHHGAQCKVNGVVIHEPTPLTQGKPLLCTPLTQGSLEVTPLLCTPLTQGSLGVTPLLSTPLTQGNLGVTPLLCTLWPYWLCQSLYCMWMN